MSKAASWQYKRKATIWRASSINGISGVSSFMAPEVISCSYGMKFATKDTPNGPQATTIEVATEYASISRGDMIALGESHSADPYSAGASVVVAVDVYGDIFGERDDYVAFLA
jgi:hypothetical protein